MHIIGMLQLSFTQTPLQVAYTQERNGIKSTFEQPYFLLCGSCYLLRAAREPEFRNQLIKQPANVLEQYNISDEAKSIIKNSILDLTQ